MTQQNRTVTFTICNLVRGMLQKGFHNSSICKIQNDTTKQNCNTYNLVYGIFCNMCQKMVYIGFIVEYNMFSSTQHIKHNFDKT